MGQGNMHSGLTKVAAALLLSMILSGAPCVGSAESGPVLPAWAGKEFRRHRLHESYAVSRNFDPVFHRGDFDGDGRLDCAALIREKSTDKVGIVILHRRGGKAFILGAGRPFGNGGDDWTWLGRWQIVAGEKVPGGKADGKDALLVEKPESAGGVVYWNGSEYDWMSYGD